MSSFNLFSCKGFRDFLQGGIEKNSQLKRGGKKAIAEAINIHPSLLSMILSGNRSFTSEQVFMLAEYLGHTELEVDYILTLYEISEASNKKFKEKLTKKLEGLRGRSTNLAERVVKERVLSDEEKSTFYSSWQYSAVRMLTTLKGGKTKDEISTRLGLDVKKVADILEFLVRTGLCRFEKGKYHEHVSRTHIEKNSQFYKQHHTNWRIKSIQKLDQDTSEDLTFTAPLTVSEEDFELIKEEMVALIKKVSVIVKDSEATNVYCFNLDFIKV